MPRAPAGRIETRVAVPQATRLTVGDVARGALAAASLSRNFDVISPGAGRRGKPCPHVITGSTHRGIITSGDREPDNACYRGYCIGAGRSAAGLPLLHLLGDLLAGLREVDILPEEPGIFHAIRKRS